MPRYTSPPLVRPLAVQRKPSWLKVRPPAGENYQRLKALLRGLDLYTVCEEAHCPNIHECWGGGTATIMLMGDTCTRGCRFCNVKSGNPRGWLDPLEPENVGWAVSQLGLDYVVLTSVDRDDLPDGGAAHFARTIGAIKAKAPNVIVEALIPDFQGDVDALRTVVDARPEVIDHNIETVESLTPKVRDPRATYGQSLSVLKNVKKLNRHIYAKSSLMLGLGETDEEVLCTMQDLRDAHVDILTLGQYLQPSLRHLQVAQFMPPAKFDELREQAEALGFLYVAAGPVVRSSYRAGEYFLSALLKDGSRHGVSSAGGGRALPAL